LKFLCFLLKSAKDKRHFLTFQVSNALLRVNRANLRMRDQNSVEIEQRKWKM
jgi:hypothetical protein